MSVDIAAVGAVDTSPGVQVWTDALGALTDAVLRNQRLQKAITTLKGQGVDTGSFEARVTSWLGIVQRLFDHLAKLVEGNETLQWLVDQVSGTVQGPGSDTPASAGLRGVSSAWRDLVAALRNPASHAGGSNELGLWPALAVALATPAVWLWIVRVILAVCAVAGLYMGSLMTADLARIIRGDAQLAKVVGEGLETCIAAAQKFSSLTERQQALDACAQLPKALENSGWMLILGGALSVGALLYFQKHKPLKSGVAGFNARRRRYA